MMQQALCLRVLVACLSVITATATWGAGIDLPTISTRNQATSNANAAEADDVSTMFYNPAGLARIREREFASSISIVTLMGEVMDMGTQRSQSIGAAPNTGPLMSDPSVPQTATREQGDFLPTLIGGGAFFVADAINDDITVGFGAFSPGGGIVDYDKRWFGRYYGNRAQILTLNLNPSIAIRLDEHHSIGLGVSALVGHAILEIKVDPYQTGPYLINAALERYDLNVGGINSGSGGIYANLPDSVKAIISEQGAHLLVDPLSEGGAKSKMWGFGYGWNIGYLYEYDEDTRFSLAYRSQSDIKFEGTIDWQTEDLRTTANLGIPNPNVLGGPITISGAELLEYYTRPDAPGGVVLKIPAKLTAGIFHRLNNKIDLLLTGVFNYSSVVQTLEITVDDVKDVDGRTVKQGSFYNDLNWRNSFSIAAGLHYHVNDRLTLKTGFMFDQTPLSGAESRSPLTPDSDRYLYSLGLNYRHSKDLTIDLAYTYFQLKDSESNYHQTCSGTYFERPAGQLGGTSECTGNAGTFRAKFTDLGGHILGAQINQKF